MDTRHSRYNPWRDLRDNWPHVQVVLEPLPERVLGLIRCDGMQVVIDSSLPRRQARCVLAHEIVHLERGLTHCLGEWRAEEERVVHDLAARRLITLTQLAAAMVQVGDDEARLVTELEVDKATLALRRAMLTSTEQLTIGKFLDDRDVWLVPAR